jgi:hypothetical protein
VSLCEAFGSGGRTLAPPPAWQRRRDMCCHLRVDGLIEAVLTRESQQLKQRQVCSVDTSAEPLLSW